MPIICGGDHQPGMLLVVSSDSEGHRRVLFGGGGGQQIGVRRGGFPEQHSLKGNFPDFNYLFRLDLSVDPLNTNQRMTFLADLNGV